MVKGDGPLNRERIAHKVDAWREGEWVRAAALAYAEKQAARARAERVTYEVPVAPGESGEIETSVEVAGGTWQMWEVFVRARRGVSHVHIGSLHAPDSRDRPAERPGRLHPEGRGCQRLGGAEQ